MTDIGGSKALRQLRLALVCEGGVSLAIYMHGLTKEIHQLVRASRAFETAYGGTPATAPDARNPFDVKTTEYAYFEELRDLATAGREITVDVDIIAGSSAGGINGVFLAHALAGGGDLSTLRDLWIRDGDLRELLNAPKFLGTWLQAVVAIGRTLCQALRRDIFPLHGDRMSQWIYDAMDQMGGTEAGTLVPDGGRLSLLVTATDIAGAQMVITSGAGGPSERVLDHRQVLRFVYDNLGGAASDTAAAPAAATPDSAAGHPPIGDFSPGALSFAARVTSAIPGAFPPVSADSFAAELGGEKGGRRVDPDRVISAFATRRHDPALARSAWYMDGGMLDNEPLDLVIDEIAHRPAHSEVLRRIVVIDPRSDAPLSVVGDAPAEVQPAALKELWRAEFTVAHDEPHRRELIELRRLNQRIAQVGAIAARQMDDVTSLLAPVLKAVGADHPVAAGAARVAGARASKALGALYPTYCRLRTNEAMVAIADTVSDYLRLGDDSDSASFVAAVLTAWARALPSWSRRDAAALVDALTGIDTPYARRQLQFVISGVNALYHRIGTAPDAPGRAELDAIKTAAWDLLGELDAAHRDAITPGGDFAATVDAVFGPTVMTEAVVLGDPADWAREHTNDLTRLIDQYAAAVSTALPRAGTDLWSTLAATTGSWSEADRDTLRSRYVGFPVWDALIFPVTAWSGLPQYTPIGVTRWGPVDAAAVPAPVEGKLRGEKFYEFGAFLKADWRRNDYLWGRLDGAELALRTLREAALDNGPLDDGPLDDGPPAGGAHLGAALAGVLAQEHDLFGTDALRVRAQAVIDRLTPTAAPAASPTTVETPAVPIPV